MTRLLPTRLHARSRRSPGRAARDLCAGSRMGPVGVPGDVGCFIFVFFLMIRRPPRSTLFPLHDALPILARSADLLWLARPADGATGGRRHSERGGPAAGGGAAAPPAPPRPPPSPGGGRGPPL